MELEHLQEVSEQEVSKVFVNEIELRDKFTEESIFGNVLMPLPTVVKNTLDDVDVELECDLPDVFDKEEDHHDDGEQRKHTEADEEDEVLLGIPSEGIVPEVRNVKTELVIGKIVEDDENDHDDGKAVT